MDILLQVITCPEARRVVFGLNSLPFGVTVLFGYVHLCTLPLAVPRS
jgi:hypothetical protein